MFRIDPRLEADSAFLGELPLCQVRLMRDARFAWLVAVPRIAGAEDLTDLARDQRAMLIEELAQLAAVLKAETAADKINVAALGNIVRQLHVHVVARFESDAAWPGPVWGSGPAEAYPPGAAGALIERLRRRLSGEARDFIGAIGCPAGKRRHGERTPMESTAGATGGASGGARPWLEGDPRSVPS